MAEVKRKKVSDPQIQNDAFEISGDVLKMDRPHKVNIEITRRDLADLKALCVMNGIKQQDKLYLMFKEALKNELK